MRNEWKVLLCVLGLCLFATAALAGGQLDGKKFTITMKGPDGKDSTDNLVFDAGNFDSIGCHEYGFGNAPYTATQKGNDWGFTATTHSEKAGEFHWMGTIHADGKIDGTATMKGKDGKTSVYQISGSSK